MKSVKTIRLKGPMASKAVGQIFKVLQNGETDRQVLFVGGCVRNAILGEEVSDIDLATKRTPEETMTLLKKARIKTVPTGIDHGTVTAVLDGESFQITTLRRDIDTDGRHAKVAFTDDWAADARRRDFTFNTLLADFQGRVFDPLNRGLRDLEKRKVVFVGDAETRIREDYLRILRFFRFHARYGKGRPDASALAACRKLRGGLKSLSKERVTEEILKILSSVNAGIIFSLMRERKILKALVDLKYKESYFKTLKIVTDIDSSTMGLLVLANFSVAGTRRIERQLRLSKNQQKQLDATVCSLRKFKTVSERELRILLYRAGPEIAELTLLSRLLLSEKPLRKWLNLLRKMERPVLPLRGQDLVDRGVRPGPEIRKALDKFERSWIRNDFQA